MIPGSVSRLSETTVASATSIQARSDVVYLTGTTQVDTILPAFGEDVAQLCILVPTDGSVILGTTGNIAVGITAVINRAVYLVWSKELQTWIISSGV